MAAVRREAAMAVEMAPGGGVDAAQHHALIDVDDHREGAGAAREHDAFRAVRPEGDDRGRGPAAADRTAAAPSARKPVVR